VTIRPQGGRWRRAAALAALALGLPSCARERAGIGNSPTAQAWFTAGEAETGLDFVHHNGMTGKLLFPEMMGPGCAFLDYDGDGDLDVFIVEGGELSDPWRPPAAGKGNRLFRNDLRESGKLHFTDVSARALPPAVGYGMGIAVGDVDGDGFPDLYVTNLGHNQLLLNRRDGTFVDATPGSGADDPRWSTSATFFDYDRDGRLDLFIANYADWTLATDRPCYAPSSARDYCGPLVYSPVPDRLLHNVGGGRFVDVSLAAGLNAAYGRGLGVVAADLDGDGWPDLYVANDGTDNQLWINQRNGTFVNNALLAGCAFNDAGQPEGSMGIGIGDVDENGDDDLFVTNFADEKNDLYVSVAPGLFEDRTRVSGLAAPSRGFTGFGTAMADFDGDSHLDLIVANGKVRLDPRLVAAGDPHPLGERNQLFRNLGNGTFEDASARGGPPFRRAEVGRGLAVGDVDNDGDLDVLISNNAGPVRLLINRKGPPASWYGFRAIDRERGSDALGARVRMILASGKPIVRSVHTDGSYLSASDPRIVFYLPAGQEARRLEVAWPGGKREAWTVDPSMKNRYTTLTRGAGSPPAGP